MADITMITNSENAKPTHILHKHYFTDSDKCSCLSSSEALYGFIGWLTSRKEQIKIASKDDATKPLHLVSAFCKENNLPELREGWSKILVMPSNK